MTSSARTADLQHRLVEVGLDELRENGLAAVSIRAVARRAGVSHAAPGYAFGDRAGLLTAMAERGFGLLREHLTADRLTGTSTAGPLVGVGEAYLDFARREPAVYSLLFDTDELDRDNPELQAAGAAAFATLVEHLPHRPAETAPVELSPLLAWSVVHGLAGLERSGALSPQIADHDARLQVENALLHWVATIVSGDAGPS